MPSPANRRSDLPVALWLWFPLTLLAIQFVVRSLSEPAYIRFIKSETALIENLTVLFLAVAIIIGIGLLRKRNQLPFPWMARWIILLCLGSFYFMGEEASWGQHWFGWSTPEALAEINRQQETNLHNNGATRWLLNILPRNLLSLAVGVGGLLIPLLKRGPRRWPDNNPRHWLWPTIHCVPAAAIASLIRLPERIPPLFGLEFPARFDIGAGETEEWALAFVIMIYFLSLRARMKRLQPTNPPESAS